MHVCYSDLERDWNLTIISPLDHFHDFLFMFSRFIKKQARINLWYFSLHRFLRFSLSLTDCTSWKRRNRKMHIHLACYVTEIRRYAFRDPALQNNSSGGIRWPSDRVDWVLAESLLEKGGWKGSSTCHVEVSLCFFNDLPPECCAFLGKERPPHSCSPSVELISIKSGEPLRRNGSIIKVGIMEICLSLIRDLIGVTCVALVAFRGRAERKILFPQVGRQKRKSCTHGLMTRVCTLPAVTNERSGMPSAVKF